MNTELFISRRLAGKDRENFSAPILRLAVLSIALGLAVMIISVAVSTGFQKTIKEKVAGFEGHIRIAKFDYNNSTELAPVIQNDTLMNTIGNIRGVTSIHPFAIKGGILKTDSVIEGVVLKGVDSNYRRNFFASALVKGRFPRLGGRKRSREIMISKTIANRLRLDTGDRVLMYFINEKPRIRKFTITGIYNSGFDEFDSRYILGDIRQIKKLNGWDKDEISGYEVYLDDFQAINSVNRKIYKTIGYDLKSETIYQRYPMIMDWLNLLDTNVFFIIALMVVISVITMISSLLILILEKTNLIGILKAVGARDKAIRKIFIYNASWLIIRGLIVGNVLGVGLALVQKYGRFIPLDPANYYMDTVPVHLDWRIILLLNAATVFITLLMLIWPSSIIARIRPARAIRFE